MMLTPIQLFFIIGLIFWGIFCVVDRICKCIERSSIAKAFGKVQDGKTLKQIDQISERLR